MSGRILDTIKATYSKAKSCVRLQGKLSQPFSSSLGVMQGDIVSPLLFSIFINDLDSFLATKYNGINIFNESASTCLGQEEEFTTYMRLFVLLYADDSIILAESPQELQKALDALHEYCTQNSITVNTDRTKEKTRIVIFSRGQVRKTPKFRFGKELRTSFTYGNEIVDIKPEYTYLGITMRFNGTFHAAIANRISQARAGMFSLMKKSRRLHLTIETQLELFETTILPIALYGCEVWGHTDLKQVEIFYKRYVKYILKLSESTPSCIIYGETGRNDITSTVHMRMVNFWKRMVNGKQSKISSVLIRLSQKLHDSSLNPIKSPWLEKIKDILTTTGLADMWEQAKHGPIPNIDGQVKSKLQESFKTQWEDKLANDPNPELFVYKHVSPIFPNQPAGYLSLPTHQAIAIAQVRSRNNQGLPAIKHKYDNEVELTCPLCKSPDPADEIHYLFRCPIFSDLRQELDFVRAPSSQGVIPGIQNLKSLFENPSKITLRRISNLIRVAEVALSKHKYKSDNSP